MKDKNAQERNVTGDLSSAADAESSGDARARALLESRGLNVTHPRRVLLALLTEIHSHPSPDAVIRELDRRGESLPPATVYQNLQILSLHGLLNRFLDAQGLSRFDAEPGPHSHLICKVCGKVENLDERAEASLVDTPELCDKTGGLWEVHPGSMHIFGLCPACRTKQ
jgi:Fe2+ or Zn2+ uptake regulation protein